MSDPFVKMYSVLASFLLLAVYQANAHSYHLGDCPTVEPVPDFDINKLFCTTYSRCTEETHGGMHWRCRNMKDWWNRADNDDDPPFGSPFLGKWYVIQKTNTGSACLVNNYTRDAEHPGRYKIEQISEHFLLGLTSVDHKYHYTGDLSIPKASTPGAMRVKFPLNVAGGASYTVFATDYDTFAGVFTCQQLTFAHRRSVSILSRTSTLDKAYIEKIRNKLSGFGVDPYNLSIIKQGNCTEVPTEHTTNININDETFTAESVANVFRKAGEKIGDGFETVADSAKKVYNKVRGDHETSNEELIVRNPKDDAEWLP